jgi:hypothetical protein
MFDGFCRKSYQNHAGFGRRGADSACNCLNFDGFSSTIATTMTMKTGKGTPMGVAAR